MKIIKKNYTQNNNEIVLIENQHDGDKTILIIGTVHGDEPQGKFLIENYLDKINHPTHNNINDFSKDLKNLPPRPLGEREEFRNEERVSEIRVRGKNRLLFIPCLNPDGLELNTRTNANEVDINRNFPTKNWVREPFASEYFGGENSASEIETKFVMEVISEFSPDIILTLHAPYKVVNYDGPAEKIAKDISAIINYPVESDIGYSTPGSFGNYAGIERNIPTITLELDEEIDVKELITPVNEIFNYLAEV
ncbi:MAG: DUF2817 domain-containing protein [Candidatus Gastranaerophilales bacterium]|nr:DUF2817 domain-containing protein [Candidatus Gastranaerophilales bacterium]